MSDYPRSDWSKSHDYIDCMMNLKKWLATPRNKNCYYLQLFYERGLTASAIGVAS